MNLIKLTWLFIQLIIGYNLILPVVFYFIWLLLKNGKRKEVHLHSVTEPDYAIIVTAYEQTDHIKAVVSSILGLNYDNYIVYIVADKCDISQLSFEDKRIILLKPSEVLASNTKSHHHALHNFIRAHDKVTIIDSDNLVDGDYLHQLNICFNKGFKAVQGIRLAKNLDTTYSCLDAARDIYYHFYDGRILFDIGSSATLSGSGMAFDTALYREFLMNNDVEGAGFDKVLQFYILSGKERIAFTEHAIVYDEKTSRSDQLVNQRSRWINTWFRYFKFGFIMVKKGLYNLNLNQFLFGVVLLRPPLFLFIIISGFCLFIDVIIDPVASLLWVMAFLVFLAGFLIALFNSETDAKIYKSLKNIPSFMFLQVVSLFKSRNANKRSVSTQHFHNEAVK